MLKQIDPQYLYTITVLFNKCTESSESFKSGKMAKGIFLLKDAAFPKVNQLYPISLLPNLAKMCECTIMDRIKKWCNDQRILVDEQSGFAAKKRLHTRIVPITEDLRLTVVACNRPALVMFVDFVTAFDRPWWSGLMNTLEKLEMSLELGKRLRDRVNHDNAKSRLFSIRVGAPQGGVIAALLYRLYSHFVSNRFLQLITHLFANDLTKDYKK